MVERWLNGETYREIAQDVGVSFVYVGKIVTRELERLRQRLRPAPAPVGTPVG
jgi:DNA-directed RNA polymerase specialized sigma24 family protein